MIDITNVDKQAFTDCYNEIKNCLESIDSDKQALKNLKGELGTIIGSDNAKETSALLKFLLKKEKDGEFVDDEMINTAEDFYALINEE